MLVILSAHFVFSTAAWAAACPLLINLLDTSALWCRYDQEEGGGFVDETHNPFLGDEADPLLKKREEMMQVCAFLCFFYASTAFFNASTAGQAEQQCC